MSSEVAPLIGPRRVARALAEALESTLGEAADQTAKQVRTELRDVPREIDRAIQRTIETQLEPFKASMAALRERIDAVEEHVTALITKRVDDAQTAIERRIQQIRQDLGGELKAQTHDVAKIATVENARDALSKEHARRIEAIETSLSERLGATTHHIGRIAEHLAEIRQVLFDHPAAFEETFLELRAPLDQVLLSLDGLTSMSARLEALEPRVEALAPPISAAPIALRALEDRMGSLDEAQQQVLGTLADFRRQSLVVTGVMVAAVIASAAVTTFLLLP